MFDNLNMARKSLKGNRKRRPKALIPKAGVTRSGKRSMELGGKLEKEYELKNVYNFN